MLNKIEDAILAGQKVEACKLAQQLIAKTGNAHARTVLIKHLDKLGVDRTLRAPEFVNAKARDLWLELRRGPLLSSEISPKRKDAFEVLHRCHLIKQYRFRWVIA